MRLFALVAAAVFFSFDAAAQPMLAEPSLSPDGKEIAFVSGDDIWVVPSGGGAAHLLASNPAAEWRPLFSPDGRSLAFVSNRTGNGDIYVLDLASGVTRRITWDDSRDQLDAWSRDGNWLYFSSNSREADGGAHDIYRVAATGGTPMMVTAEKMAYEYHSAPAPDGRKVAFVARGFANGQWWRHGHSHMDTSQIAELDETGRYRTLTEDGAKQLWPMWSPDGSRLYFVSDRGGRENIWVTDGKTARKITNFGKGRVLWPNISSDGKTIVFERDFGIWKLDLGNGTASPVAITLRGAPATAAIDHRRITDRFSDFALSPDGKKVAFVARGEVFAASAKDAGDAARVTNTAGIESQPAWSPDSKSIVYVSDRDGSPHLFRYEFATERETQLTRGDGSDIAPRFSPDGKHVAFERNYRDLMILELATSNVRKLATGYFDRQPFAATRELDFSPDSKWLAYLSYGNQGLRNAWVVPVSGGQPRQVSFTANTFGDSISWSPDGKFLLLQTGQRTETSIIQRVDLVPQVPKLREEQFRDLFRETRTEDKPAEKPAPSPAATVAPDTKPGKTPVEVVFEGIRKRSRIVPVALDVDEQTISPDGKWIAFIASVGDDQNVYVYSIDELATDPAVPKQLSSTTGRKRQVQFSSDSKEVWYLDGGRIAAATIDPAKTRTVAVVAEMDVDFAREKEQAFAQAWRLMGENFYDEQMNGVDWNAARETYGRRVAAARNPDEFRRILQLMVGELNASHLGATAPADSARTATGRIGVRFDRMSWENENALKVTEVVPLSPADVSKIRAGEYIVAVDGKPVSAASNFDAMLDYKIGKRTVISVAPSADGLGKRDVVLQPIRGSEERALIFEAWVNANRDYVARVSNGRLGYVAMYDMSFDSLQQLYLDLDAENRAHEGVVIDLRNNHGGFVNTYAIDVFSRRGYMTMETRGYPALGARTALGQRALEKPTVLVINRHSLSDAEDFTEGYRTLKLGPIVGEPTAGWIVYTSNTTLLDGTVFRLPSTRILDASGKDMENNPRPVDRLVIRPVGEGLTAKDSQLDAAVEELLKTLK